MPDDKQFDVEGARNAGYSDDEIINHLAQSRNFDVEGAKKSGYSSNDIIGYLTTPKAATPSSSSLVEQGQKSFAAKGGNVGMPGSFEGHPENVGEYIPQTVGNIASGIGNIAQGNVARGTHEVLTGGMNTLLPAAPFAAAAAPAAFALGGTGSYVGGKVGRGAATIFGRTPDQQDLAEDIGSIAGGALPFARNPVSSKLLTTDTGEPRLGLKLLSPKRAEAIADYLRPDVKANAKAASEQADILAERQKRMAAYAEMQEDFANRAKQQQKDLANRVTDAEKARQKEITDWAKLDKVNEADHQAFADRMSQIEDERQSALADMEKFRQQHAQSLMQRGAQQQAIDTANAQRLADIEKARQGDLAAQERIKQQHAEALNARKGAKPPPAPPPPSPFAGMTSSAPGAVPTTATLPGVPQGSPTLFPQRPGGLIPPPSPEPVSAQPTIGSQIAERNKSSILSRGRTLYQPGEEPNLNDPVHAKIINDLQTRSGPELRTMAKNGDRFAAFVLRNMPRP